MLSGAASNVVMDMVSMTEFVVEDIAKTVSSISSFNSVEVLKNELRVVLIFVFLWSLAVGAIITVSVRNRFFKVPTHKQHRSETSHRSDHVNAALLLRKYVENVFPSAFVEDSDFREFSKEIWRHHSYLDAIRSLAEHEDSNAVIIKVAYLLTIQTVLVFTLILFYDFQGKEVDSPH